MKKKNSKKSKPIDKLFDFFVTLAIEPVDFCVKHIFYPLSIILGIAITACWAVPMIFLGALATIIYSMGEFIVNLIKRK